MFSQLSLIATAVVEEFGVIMGLDFSVQWWYTFKWITFFEIFN